MSKKAKATISIIILAIVLCTTFVGVDILWKLGQWKNIYNTRFLLPSMKIANTTADRYKEVVVKLDIKVPMRDGARLYTDVYLPKTAGKFPVILIRLPYGKQEYYCFMPAIGKYFAKKGYACVVQDVRGKFKSEGTFSPFVNEKKDGYDTIDWVIKQQWCNGNVGMMGESYYCYTTFAAALSAHPNLKAIVGINMGLNAYDLVYRQGAFCLQPMGSYPILMDSKTYQNILRLNMWELPLKSIPEGTGLKSSFFKQLVENPTPKNPLWEKYNLDKYDKIKIPSLHIGGWYDNFIGLTIKDWQGVVKSSGVALSKSNHWLFIGPWDHEFSTDDHQKIGQLGIGNDHISSRWDEMQHFFDKFLMGVKNGYEKTPRVKLYVIGGTWRSENEWPLARTKFTRYYIHSTGNAQKMDDGKLTTTKPVNEPHDSYIYDPANPVQIMYGKELWQLAAAIEDRKSVEERDDVLVYTTLKLESDIELTGPITATLYAASSGVDTDFTVALVDVFPNGYTHLLKEGIIRTSYRKSHHNPTPIVPNKIYKFKIDLWAISHIVKKGHKIRVEISSSNFDRFSRNLNTGKPYGTSSKIVKVHQKIYHTREYPSHITLPVVPKKN